MKILHEGTWARFVDDNGWEYVERHTSSGIVVIVPVTADGEIVLVEQYRRAVKSRVLELPAGLVGDVDAGESFEAAAARELVEETGYEAELRFLLRGPLSPGITSEVGHFFLAPNARKIGTGGGDETEDITVHVVPLGQTEEWLKSQIAAGKYIEPKVYAGLYWARLRDS
ncbi:MAG: NUDIX hydrolase [Alphaproteobacteria bacterium]|nr:NUDIX hydrolase [Alphaproteobacteria bacterium]